MKKYSYCVIGSFLKNKPSFGGQSIKTRTFADALKEHCGKESVLTVDTYGWKKHPLRLVFNINKAIRSSDEIVILPANRGVYVIPKLVLFLAGRKPIKVHYVVIGGFLPGFVEKSKSLASAMKKMHGIYVETSTMKKALESQGFTNVAILPNFKKINPLTPDELSYIESEPLPLCTFSRVLKEKGIGDISDAVMAVNRRLGRMAFTLDIYGKVDKNQVEWFENLKSGFDSSVRYLGTVPPDQSVQTLKKYYSLVFPTHYYTEGIPGTLIDAYSAGIPVISAKWESFTDVVDDHVTGLGYEIDNQQALINILLEIADDPSIMNKMKENCLKKAKEFDSEEAIKILASF